MNQQVNRTLTAKQANRRQFLATAAKADCVMGLVGLGLTATSQDQLAAQACRSPSALNPKLEQISRATRGIWRFKGQNPVTSGPNSCQGGRDIDVCAKGVFRYQTRVTGTQTQLNPGDLTDKQSPTIYLPIRQPIAPLGGE